MQSYDKASSPQSLEQGDDLERYNRYWDKGVAKLSWLLKGATVEDAEWLAAEVGENFERKWTLSEGEVSHTTLSSILTALATAAGKGGAALLKEVKDELAIDSFSTRAILLELIGESSARGMNSEASDKEALLDFPEEAMPGLNGKVTVKVGIASALPRIKVTGLPRLADTSIIMLYAPEPLQEALAGLKELAHGDMIPGGSDGLQKAVRLIQRVEEAFQAPALNSRWIGVALERLGFYFKDMISSDNQDSERKASYKAALNNLVQACVVMKFSFPPQLSQDIRALTLLTVHQIITKSRGPGWSVCVLAGGKPAAG